MPTLDGGQRVARSPTGEATTITIRPPLQTGRGSPRADQYSPVVATTFFSAETPSSSSEHILLSEIYPALRPRPDEETPNLIPASAPPRTFAGLPYATFTANRLDPNVNFDLYARSGSAGSRISITIPCPASRQGALQTNATAPSPTFFGVSSSVKMARPSSRASIASSASTDTIASRRHEGRSTPT